MTYEDGKTVHQQCTGASKGLTRRDPNAGKRVLTPSREYATVVETSADGFGLLVSHKDGGQEWLPVVSCRVYP